MTIFSFFTQLIGLASLAMVTISSAAAHEDSSGEGHSKWSFTEEHDGIVYLSSHDTPSIERFDLNTEAWLEPLIPPGITTAFTVDLNGIVIATDLTLYSVESGETEFDFFANTTSSVLSLASDHSSLYVSMSGNGAGRDPSYTELNRIDGTTLQTRDIHRRMSGTRYSALFDLLVGRSVGVSPSDIEALELYNSSDHSAVRDSPYHGRFPTATKVWLSPNEDHVIDDAGVVYSLPDLTWVASTAGSISNPVFTNDSIYVLSEGVVKKLDAQYREIGQYAVNEKAEALYAHNGNLFTFSFEDGAPQVTIVAESSVTASAPGPADLTTLRFSADMVLRSADGSIWLLSNSNQVLAQYSLETKSFTEAYSLQDTPTAISPAVDTNSFFIGYDNGSITRLSLATGAEESVVNLASGVVGLLAFEGKLFASDLSGFRGTFYTIDSSGVILSSADLRHVVPNPVWVGASREVVLLGGSTLVVQEILPDYTLAHNSVIVLSNGPSINKLALSADESLVLAQNGHIYDTATHSVSHSLGQMFDDIAWASDGFIASIDNTPEPLYFPVSSTGLIEDVEEQEPMKNRIDFRVWGNNYEQLRWVTFDAISAKVLKAETGVLLVIDEYDKVVPTVFEVREGSDDLDSDGVADSQDAFPIDPLRSSIDGVVLEQVVPNSQDTAIPSPVVGFVPGVTSPTSAENVGVDNEPVQALSPSSSENELDPETVAVEANADNSDVESTSIGAANPITVSGGVGIFTLMLLGVAGFMRRSKLHRVSLGVGRFN